MRALGVGLLEEVEPEVGGRDLLEHLEFHHVFQEALPPCSSPQ